MPSENLQICAICILPGESSKEQQQAQSFYLIIQIKKKLAKIR